jgi:hypothetical protein
MRAVFRFVVALLTATVPLAAAQNLNAALEALPQCAVCRVFRVTRALEEASILTMS